MKRIIKSLTAIIVMFTLMAGGALAAGMVDLPIYRDATKPGNWEKKTLPNLKEAGAVDGETLIVNRILNLQCSNENWKEVCGERDALNQRLRERNPILRGETVGIDAFLSAARGNGFNLPVPEGFEKKAYAQLVQAPTAPPGAVGNGAGATPALAASPAAPAPDQAALVEMKRQLAAITAARQSETAAATASNNALSGRIDGVGQQASAAARAASAVQETARRLGGRVEGAEKMANAASGVAGEAKAQARGAAASAAGATADAAKARTDAASAVGLAYDTSLKVEGFEKALKTVQLTVNQIDWRPFAALAAFALLTCGALWYFRNKVTEVKTIATKAHQNAADVQTQVTAIVSTVAGHTADIGELKADVRGVRDVVEGQPGFTQLADGRSLFYHRLMLLGPNTHPTMACQVVVTDDDGVRKSLNINITAVGNNRFTVEGVRDQGGNSLAYEDLDKKILRAGRQGRIVGCEPYVPPADSPSNGPKTVQDVAKLPPATHFPRRAGRTQLVAAPLSDPDPDPVPVPAFLRAPRGDLAAVGDQPPDTAPVPFPTTSPASLLAGLPARSPESLPHFDADQMMVEAPTQAAANGTPPTATGTAGS